MKYFECVQIYLKTISSEGYDFSTGRRIEFRISEVYSTCKIE